MSRAAAIAQSHSPPWTADTWLRACAFALTVLVAIAGITATYWAEVRRLEVGQVRNDTRIDAIDARTQRIEQKVDRLIEVAGNSR